MGIIADYMEFYNDEYRYMMAEFVADKVHMYYTHPAFVGYSYHHLTSRELTNFMFKKVDAGDVANAMTAKMTVDEQIAFYNKFSSMFYIDYKNGPVKISDEAFRIIYNREHNYPDDAFVGPYAPKEEQSNYIKLQDTIADTVIKGDGSSFLNEEEKENETPSRFNEISL